MLYKARLHEPELFLWKLTFIIRKISGGLSVFAKALLRTSKNHNEREFSATIYSTWIKSTCFYKITHIHTLMNTTKTGTHWFNWKDYFKVLLTSSGFSVFYVVFCSINHIFKRFKAFILPNKTISKIHFQQFVTSLLFWPWRQSEQFGLAVWTQSKDTKLPQLVCLLNHHSKFESMPNNTPVISPNSSVWGSVWRFLQREFKWILNWGVAKGAETYEGLCCRSRDLFLFDTFYTWRQKETEPWVCHTHEFVCFMCLFNAFRWENKQQSVWGGLLSHTEKTKSSHAFSPVWHTHRTGLNWIMQI